MSVVECVVGVILTLLLALGFGIFFGPGVLVPSFIVLMSVISAAVARTNRREGAGTVFLDEDGLRVRTSEALWERRYPTSSFQQGFDLPTEKSVTFHLDGGHRLTFETDDTARILEHLGLSAAQHTATFTMREAFAGLAIAVIGFLILLVPVTLLSRLALAGPNWDLGMVISAVLAFWLGYRFGSTRFVVGSDGVFVIGRFRRTFIPYTEIDSIDTAPLRILRKDGRMVTLPAVEPPAAAAAIDRMARARSLSGTSASMAALARGSQSIVEWRETIQRVVGAGATYRDARIGVEALERAVADAAAPLDIRVGAAMALRALDDTAAPRIRVVAESTAEDDTRDALVAAAYDDLDLDAIDRATRNR